MAESFRGFTFVGVDFSLDGSHVVLGVWLCQRLMVVCSMGLGFVVIGGLFGLLNGARILGETGGGKYCFERWLYR